MSENHTDYKKIYFTLLGLLVVSVAGPFLGIQWVTLVTAFGIAIVKANLVVQNFMHLRVERAWIKWMLSFSVLMMLLLFYGVAPDIMRHDGQNWTNVAAQVAVERGLGDGEHAEEGTPAGGDAAAAPVIAASDVEAAGNYATYCAFCHGAGGRGDGVASSAFATPPADFGDAAFWATRTDADVARAITDGGAAVGRSQTMPPWNSVLDDAQAAAMVVYLKSFQTGD